MNSNIGNKLPVHRLKSYLKYRFRATDLHGIHPPFLYKLAEQAIYKKKRRYFFDEMEEYLLDLKYNDQTIDILDLGAGSTINQSNTRRISDIHKNSGKPQRIREIMFELVDQLKLTNRIELGTSLGVTTAYLSEPLKGRVITLEGCPETAAVAQENWKEWGVSAPELVLGNFDETLEGVLKDIKRVDLFYVDGNHRSEPTLRYFEQSLPYAHEGSVFIFDDIYWSEDMTEAWEAIKAHNRVTLSVDLFEIGIAFIDPALSKQSFALRW